jgi:tRNA 2-thiouridine synthesizing protein A
MPDMVVDTRGLNCPLPVIKARRAFKSLAVGAVMEVLATDPLAEADFHDFCEAVGAALLRSSRDDHGVFCFHIQRL